MDAWSLRLYSWLSDINSSFSLLKIHKKIINNYSLQSSNFPLTIILLWVILYAVYNKCLHLLFRRMQYPLLVRRRIIDGLWTIGFALSSVFYLTLLVPESLIDSTCLLKRPRYLDLGFILHKSFYLHHGIVEILTHNSWLRGIINLVFCVTIHSLSEQKSFSVASELLYCKATLTAIINTCRVFTSVKNKRRLLFVKLFLIVHFINWANIIFIIITDFKLWNAKGFKNDWLTLICLWIWLFLELFNETSNIRLAFKNSNHKLEAYLFPPPTEEMIEIKNICKKLRERSANQDYDLTNDKKKAELWQILCCAMTLKKKAKRMREAKNKLDLDQRE